MTDFIAQQETEYGYRLPDGTEVFGPVAPPLRGFFPSGGLRTVRGQNQSRELYRRYLKDAGLPETVGNLTFVQRVRTVSYSPAIPLVPEDQHPDLSDEVDDF